MSALIQSIIDSALSYLTVEAITLSVASFIWIGFATVVGRAALVHLEKKFPRSLGRHASLKKVKAYRKRCMTARADARETALANAGLVRDLNVKTAALDAANDEIIRLKAAMSQLLVQIKPAPPKTQEHESHFE